MDEPELGYLGVPGTVRPIVQVGDPVGDEDRRLTFEQRRELMFDKGRRDLKRP